MFHKLSWLNLTELKGNTIMTQYWYYMYPCRALHSLLALLSTWCDVSCYGSSRQGALLLFAQPVWHTKLVSSAARSCFVILPFSVHDPVPSDSNELRIILHTGRPVPQLAVLV